LHRPLPFYPAFQKGNYYTAIQKNKESSYISKWRKDAEICENIENAFLYAAQEGYADVLKAMLSIEAKVSKNDKAGWTALNIARKKNHKEIVQLLKKAGATT
jgi:hypothetical protein